MHRLAAVVSVFLLVPLAVLPAEGTTIRNPSLAYGQTVTLDTDATSGTVTLYEPNVSGSGCLSQVLSMPAPYDGQLRGIRLDRAGLWRLDHTTNAGTDTTAFRVQPQPLRILATATPAAMGSYDYTVQVAYGSQQAPYAYLDVYYGAALVRHLRTDASGQVNVYASSLPYAGVYQLVAYRDLGNPPFTYSNAYTQQVPAPCDGTYNDPEQYQAGAEVGNGYSAVTKDTVPLQLDVTQGPIQVRHVAAPSRIQVESPAGEPILPSQVQILANGQVVAPASLGLSLSVSPGLVVLNGTWDSPSDVAVSMQADTNADGVPEYTGTAQIQVRNDLPIRVIPVLANGTPDPNPALAYRVPAPNPDGTPGKQVLRFRVLDTDGNEGRPPALSAIAVQGDLLPGASVAFDAARAYWVATATPANSDSDYRLQVAWPTVGSVTLVVNMPRDGGAATRQEYPVGHLVAGVRQDAVVRVQRFNPAAISQQSCQPLPECAYENVTDADVRLNWADTGKPVLDAAGQPYEYIPGRAEAACSCYEYQGTYRFQHLLLNRSGLLVATAKINVPSGNGSFAYSYTPLQVDPQPSYTPTINPSNVLAGIYTRYALTSAGLSAQTLGNFDVHLLDASGRDVADPGNFTTDGAQVFLNAVLPEGNYSLVVQDHLDPFATPPQLGQHGTLSPGILRVRDADIRFAYTDAPLYPSTLGVDLQSPLNQSFVLGGSLGKIVQLRVDAFAPDGQRAPGTIHLEAYRNDAGVARAFAIMAYSDQNQPTTVGAPRLYAPDDPQLAWMCSNPSEADPNLDDCGSYYFSQLPTPNFAMALDLAYNAQPVLIYVFGVQTGDVRVSFLPAGSNLNQREATHSTIHIVPPSMAATRVDTRLGSTNGTLVVGLDNLAELHGWDPTGYNTLDGYGAELARNLYGASQVPGGILHYQAGSPFGVAHVAVVPDASGPLSAYVIQGVALVDTGLRVPVLDSSQVTFNTTSIQVFVDLPSQADEGTAVPIRVGTANDPFPQGAVVQAFGQNVTLVSGSGSLLAPFVDKDTDFPVIVHVPGLTPVIQGIRIHDLAHQVHDMQVQGVPTSVKEGQAFSITVLDAGHPLPGVLATLLAANATTDAQGDATLQAPLVSKTLDAWLTVSRANYTTLQFPVQVLDVGRPQLVFEVAHSMEAGKQYTVTVRAVNERGEYATVPANLLASVEAQRASGIHFDGLAGASWPYEAPRLTQDTRIYAFARADGYDSAATLITIKEANP